MSFHVKVKVVTPWKGSVTELAPKWAVTGVFAHVSRELVRSRELPPASIPSALVRLLSYNTIL